MEARSGIIFGMTVLVCDGVNVFVGRAETGEEIKGFSTSFQVINCFF